MTDLPARYVNLARELERNGFSIVPLAGSQPTPVASPNTDKQQQILRAKISQLESDKHSLTRQVADLKVSVEKLMESAGRSTTSSLSTSKPKPKRATKASAGRGARVRKPTAPSVRKRTSARA